MGKGIFLREMLAYAGDTLRLLNPSLLSYPPPYIEKTGVDICYKGPNGESDADAVVLCQSLPYGMRGQVASWYIHPERHIIEAFLLLFISIICVKRVLATHLSHPSPEKDFGPEPPLLMKLTTSMVMTLHMTYKMSARMKWSYMTAPCNLSWVVYWAVCYIPMPCRARQFVYQLMIPFLAFPTLAFIAPEESTLTNWMERPFFYIHHALLVVFAMYLLRSGRVSMLPTKGSVISSLLYEWMMAFGVFGVYMSALTVPLSIIYGLNLNYVMSPPNTYWSGGWFEGPWYRVFLVGYFAAKFLFIQVIVVMYELLHQRKQNSSKESKMKDE